MIFLAVGGAWMFADRLGLSPLGFAPLIVTLTAVHFHYAGFVLPVITGLAIRRAESSWMARGAGWGVVAGVPLVAVGITATQLGFGQALESVAGLILALSGLLTAALHLRLGLRPEEPLGARCLWMIAGCSLVSGMALAAFYALRFFVPLPWLSLPWMWAAHGTINALGFGLAGALSWRRAMAAG